MIAPAPRVLIRGALAAAVLLLTALALAAAPGQAAAACKNADARARTVSEKAQEKAVRCLINEVRSDRGLTKLKNQKQLRSVARKHSKFEAKSNCISHDCADGSFDKRIKRSGYTDCNCSWSAGEVIGWRRLKASTAREMVDAWFNSPAHRANLLTPSRRDIGVGVVYGSPRPADDDKTVEAAIYTVVIGSQN